MNNNETGEIGLPLLLILLEGPAECEGGRKEKRLFECLKNRFSNDIRRHIAFVLQRVLWMDGRGNSIYKDARDTVEAQALYRVIMHFGEGGGLKAGEHQRTCINK